MSIVGFFQISDLLSMLPIVKNYLRVSWSPLKASKNQHKSTLMLIEIMCQNVFLESILKLNVFFL